MERWINQTLDEITVLDENLMKVVRESLARQRKAQMRMEVEEREELEKEIRDARVVNDPPLPIPMDPNFAATAAEAAVTVVAAAAAAAAVTSG